MKKIAQKLFALWLGCFLATALIGKIYIEVFQYRNGYSPAYFLSGYQFAIAGVSLFVFCPVLLFAQKYAQKEKNKGILVASRLMLVLCSLVWVITLLQMLCK